MRRRSLPTATPEPQRPSNAHDAALTPTERTDLIRATLELAYGNLDLWGQKITVTEVLRTLGYRWDE